MISIAICCSIIKIIYASNKSSIAILQSLQIIRGLNDTVTIMNPLKYKKQWEKQWTKGRDRGVLNRHPRSASGSLNSGDSSSSSISSSPSPQYSPEISQTETELNSQPDAQHK